MSRTPNFNFELIDFDRIPWHGREHDNWRLTDAVFAKFISITNIKGVWQNATAVVVGDRYVDAVDGSIWTVAVAHTTASTGTFATDRAAHTTYWTSYSSEQHLKGTWTTATAYSINDFVVSGHIYAVCLTAHTSGATFAGDSTKWEYLINATATVASTAASAAAALASEVAAAASAAKLTGTSTTSLLIAVASKTFTTQSGKFFEAGQWLLVVSDADVANYMHGQVTSYSGTTLVLNVTNVGGSGTFADWTITVSGTRGSVGATGSTGATGATGAAGVVQSVTAGDTSITVGGSAANPTVILSAAVATAAARTVMDDVTVAAMVDTLGGATSTGTGGIARATSPVFTTPALGTPASGDLRNCTVASATVAGIVPTPPNNTTTFLRGDATFAAPTNGFTLGTENTTTGGTAITFGSIPAGTKMIVINLAGLSLTATSNFIVQIGDAGGLEVSGYSGTGISVQSPSTITFGNDTSGTPVFPSVLAATAMHGQIILTLQDAAAFTWTIAANLSSATANDIVAFGAGSKSLSAELTQVSLTTAAGTATFDVNSGVNVMYIG